MVCAPGPRKPPRGGSSRVWASTWFKLAGPIPRGRVISMPGWGSVVRGGIKVASGCGLVVTPLANKLTNLEVSLACWEMNQLVLGVHDGLQWFGLPRVSHTLQ